MKKALVTGSAGLIGSESVRFLIDKGYTVIGIDNNMRQYFFGTEASTDWNKNKLVGLFKDAYIHYNTDIRDQKSVEQIFQEHTFELIIHTAAQPSHDWAAKEPLTDFSINATATLILLEAYRTHCPEATFIFTSTNKVYGDTPNTLPFIETDTRYELPPEHHYFKGIDESLSIDQSKHSVFGASKISADIMVQEYGKYFGLRTGVFRGGCLTGPNHSGAQLHGFLSYLVKTVATGNTYTVFGYKGKQVRDNIHSSDLVRMFWAYHQNPRQGEVYNAGGGRELSTSILEAIERIERIANKKASYQYVDTARSGDHIWYITDFSKFQSHYPEWNTTYTLDNIIAEIYNQGNFN